MKPETPRVVDTEALIERVMAEAGRNGLVMERIDRPKNPVAGRRPVKGYEGSLS